jgi:glycosyltransferase involved in cell wall biosynthesis
MKISIVIPTKNRAKVLQRSLSSAVFQTNPADEIIVADNNSTDNTKEVIESFNDSRIVHLHTTEDFPITANWIRGIRAASGDWVKIIYDDDWIESTFLERTVPNAFGDRVMIHVGGTIHTFEGSSLYCTSKVDTKQTAHGLLKRGMLGVSPGGALIKKSALDYAIEIMPRLDSVCIDSGIGPDVILLYAETTKKSSSWIHIPEVLAHYDGRYGSLTIKTLKEDASFLHNCYKISFNLLDDLHKENL